MNCLCSLTKTWINPRPICIASIKNMFTHSINPIPMHITPVYFHVDSIVQELLLLPAYFPPRHSARSRKAKSQNLSSKKLPSFSGRGLTVPDGGWGPVKYIFPHLLINFPHSLDAGVWADFCTLKIDPHRRVETITNSVGSFFITMSHEKPPLINNKLKYISNIEMFIVIYVHSWG